MNKKGFIFTVFLFGALIVVLSVLVGIKLANNGPDDSKKKSDEYIYYSEMFQLELSSDESYYSILRLYDTSLSYVEIPDTIDDIPVRKLLSHKDSNNFASWNSCVTIRIGKNVEYIGSDPNNEGILNGGSLGDNFLSSLSKAAAIVVDEANPVYASKDGVLYNKDFTILIKYPNNKVDSTESFNVIIPNTVKSIYHKAFYYNTKITKVVFGIELEEIGNLAFAGCEKLTTVTFNNKLKTIGQSAFKDCDLTSITLPESVETLGDLAFSYNDNLDYCYIAENCKSFGKDIFADVADNFTIVTTTSNLPILEEVEALKFYKKRSLD